ncbi:methylated-DNA--[protein]-cysteine S-methyltransferase [Suttonella sp. R2A3]|uniref:methylated-DNA--[protein]-cysteine S-methyltransferase n=1 Tax=Suttonella sp. R2A3 TaxID=2908648 RepID=UPI001F463323|nr:methylated-DNA--[protein]-cysteine S-methyltransferase [Suttonella sp. R2A3]UJF24169.1 methylated-DNA--[protein]-cysteine S-methyltransferase [Suttonella sp. R2A3]
MNETLLATSSLKTPLGEMYLVAGEQGVCSLEYCDSTPLADELASLAKYLGKYRLSDQSPHIELAKDELVRYFNGDLQTFATPLWLIGTPFQQQVWRALQTIAYGETLSYGAQAERINNPKAVRAVARANGQNRISIIIPCHRVIGSDGSLTGYAGGLSRKAWLLEYEQAVKHNPRS